MANRYTNLQGSKKISEDFNNINIGFDRVQEDMDKKASADNPVFTGTPTAPTQPAGDNSNKLATTKYADRAAGTVQTNLDKHTADKVVHVTQADHDKLGGIQEGAEVNQNAFAKVNDIAAADPSSQFFIVGDVGIKVTTNPATGEVKITAVGDAAPGPHGPTHTEHGADPIPTATLTEGGLLSAAQFAEIVAHGELLDEHSAAITALEDRLDTAESETLTLQPGLQLVTSKRDARFKLGAIKGKSEINGQGRIGIIGVENPYVTRIGQNLLPPFYEWTQGGNIRLDSPYDVTITAASTTQEFLQYDFVPMSNQTYTISGANIRVVDLTNVVILAFTGNTSSSQTFSVPASCKQLRIVASNATQATVGTGNIVTSPGTYRTQNPTLNFGDKSLSFTPREDVMLAFQTELYANPNDGSEPDELFERDGQYFKLAKWRKLILDGALNWLYGNGGSGYKWVNLFISGQVLDSGIVTKSDGVLLGRRNAADGISGSGPDKQMLRGDLLSVTISNTDSGWGDNYTPTTDEIKAYFMGWRMRQLNSLDPYNGSGEKSWGTVKSGGAANWTSILPTSPAPDWNPYNLLYKLASPTVEPVMSEGCLTLTEGDNQIEVGTGIILRERANPVADPYNQYQINVGLSGFEASRLKNKALQITNVYKNNRNDSDWYFNNSDAYGNVRAIIKNADYEQSASYSVTYIKLDKSPVVPITGSLAANEKAQLTDLMTGVQEALQRVSVAELKKAEKDAPGWITPTLLNGALPGTTPVEYKKKNGFVIIRGVYTSKAGSILLFKLPVGYRPKYVVRYGQMGVTGGQLVQSNIEIYPNGDVGVGYIGTDYMVLDGIIFEAEQ
ncbi:hypothetical protein J2TS6_54780 [Paenibacillus albilobatus]|uniref:Tail fiber protein n=1 Tax=Paenibacillus albilobatus TaxID=2716884 RepID=A0A919XK03_9BACL|nr:hypothetical protein [Paenibacillus albilobatus]GIO34337.1 hypothetical protein J2TS6_54780 [Paenibacillus albilobatus]